MADRVPVFTHAGLNCKYAVNNASDVNIINAQLLHLVQFCRVTTYNRVKQAAHWHEFCSRNAPQYGAPSRAILVARSLSRRQSHA